jgi:hypothetical protein
MTGARARKLGVTRYLAAIFLTAALGGCVETADSLQMASVDTAQHTAVPAGVSPSGASVAFASLEGPPATLTARFTGQIAAAAASRAIVVADSPSANYLVRGYLTAYPVPEGTAITYVWDVFDSQKRHARRMEDTITLKASAGNPWSLVDDAIMAGIAAKSADDLAAYLSNTPEAVAAATARPPAQLAAAPANFASPAAGGAASQGLLSYR